MKSAGGIHATQGPLFGQALFVFHGFGSTLCDVYGFGSTLCDVGLQSRIHLPYERQCHERVVEGAGELPLRPRLVRLPLDHEQLDHAVVLVAYVVLPEHKRGDLSCLFCIFVGLSGNS